MLCSSKGALFEQGCSCAPNRQHVHAACLRSLNGTYACSECGQEYTGTVCTEIARVALERAKCARPLDVTAVLICQLNLAYTQCMLGGTACTQLDLERHTAQRDLERCIVSMTETLGAKHPLPLLARSRLCLVLLVQGKFDDATALARALYDTAMVEGPHQFIRLTRNVLASVSVTKLRETKKIPHAEILLEAQFVAAPTSAPTMRRMVGLLYGQRRFYEAADFAERSFKLTVAALGPNHKDTLLDAAVVRKVNGRIGRDATAAAAAAAAEAEKARVVREALYAAIPADVTFGGMKRIIGDKYYIWGQLVPFGPGQWYSDRAYATTSGYTVYVGEDGVYTGAIGAPITALSIENGSRTPEGATWSGNLRGGLVRR